MGMTLEKFGDWLDEQIEAAERRRDTGPRGNYHIEDGRVTAFRETKARIQEVSEINYIHRENLMAVFHEAIKSQEKYEREAHKYTSDSAFLAGIRHNHQMLSEGKMLKLIEK